MAKSDHPAAKAGRFVRAFGLTLQGELEKRAAVTAAAPAARPAPPPPPPPIPTTGVRARATFVLFVLALVALGLVILHAASLLPATAGTAVRLLATGVMFVEGVLLLSNWQNANRALVQRVLNRTWGPRGAVTRRERAFARSLREILALLAIVFLAAAAFELLATTVGG